MSAMARIEWRIERYHVCALEHTLDLDPACGELGGCLVHNSSELKLAHSAQVVHFENNFVLSRALRTFHQ